MAKIKINLDAIDDVQLPIDLNERADEEKIFEETPEEQQDDHKSKELLLALQEKAKQELDKLKIENANLKKLSDHRITYSWWIFVFVFLFVATVLGIVILKGTGKLILDNEVVDVLLVTNTVQVVGVLYIIAKWLYPNGK